MRFNKNILICLERNCGVYNHPTDFTQPLQRKYSSTSHNGLIKYNSANAFVIYF